MKDKNNLSQRSFISSKKQRDPYIDNIRLALVIFVVLGHLISPFKNENELIYFLNNFLATFRMPALVMLTGFFAKNFQKEGYIEKITIKLFIPYLIFQFLYSYDHDFSVNWFNPSMGLWFLLSLYFWNLMLFIFTHLKYPIVISLITGIGIGLVEDAGHYFSIARTFTFFPFFLFGFYLKTEHIHLLKTNIAKKFSVIAAIAIISILNSFPPPLIRGLLLGKHSFEQLNLNDLEGILLKILIYFMMILGILTILPWIPKKRFTFSYYGQKTAYIYILHLFIIGLLHKVAWFDYYELWKFIVSPLIALAISFVLCTKSILLISRPFIEGTIIYNINLLLKKLLLHFPKHIWKSRAE